MGIFRGGSQGFGRVVFMDHVCIVGLISFCWVNIYVCIGVSEVINRVIGDGAMGYFGKSISE